MKNLLKFTTWGSTILGILLLIFGSSYYEWNLAGQLLLALASFLFSVWGRALLREKIFSQGQLFLVFTGFIVLGLGIWDVPDPYVLVLEIGMLSGSALEFIRIKKWIQSEVINIVKKSVAAIATLLFILTFFFPFLGEVPHWSASIILSGQVFLIWAFSGVFQKKYKFNFILGTIGGAIITIGSCTISFGSRQLNGSIKTC
ncbi:hypothetical protein HN954_03505 [bacterium]|jgi:hypothetical protein|nr:hypothetical protein [bacterium]MBT6832244.1 hypothetical protein [bacterium]MBT6996469.1 hypothetical protein [bacterium]MBT7772283.1 hypothetical protein [bacterium]